MQSGLIDVQLKTFVDHVRTWLSQAFPDTHALKHPPARTLVFCINGICMTRARSDIAEIGFRVLHSHLFQDQEIPILSCSSDDLRATLLRYQPQIQGHLQN